MCIRDSGKEVGHGPGHIVLDGAQLPIQEGGTAAPHFSVQVCCGQTAGLIKMPLGTEVGRGPSDVVLDGDPAPPTERGTSAPCPLFGPLLWHGRPSQLLLSTGFSPWKWWKQNCSENRMVLLQRPCDLWDNCKSVILHFFYFLKMYSLETLI